MQSSIIGKIEKANRYARERDRVTISQFSATFRGEHDSYTVGLEKAKWHCSCHFFSQWGLCSHTMAMQKILADVLPQEALARPNVPV